MSNDNQQLEDFAQGRMPQLHPRQFSEWCHGAGIVDQATSIALHRDIGKGRPKGMSKHDLLRAVECVFQQNFDLNHNDEIADFVHEYHIHVSTVINLCRRIRIIFEVRK